MVFLSLDFTSSYSLIEEVHIGVGNNTLIVLDVVFEYAKPHNGAPIPRPSIRLQCYMGFLSEKNHIEVAGVPDDR